MPTTKVRITAHIEDIIDVQHEEGASEDEILKFARGDWQYVEYIDMEAELA